LCFEMIIFVLVWKNVKNNLFFLWLISFIFSHSGNDYKRRIEIERVWCIFIENFITWQYELGHGFCFVCSR
jgi:hypothetical protein